jgi:hypothetical protein
MYVKDGNLLVEKGFFTFDAFYEAYKPVEDCQAIVHFRIKTHGPIDLTNCHPFNINETFGFAHNGIISGFGDAKVSDTIVFNEEVLQPLVKKYGTDVMFEPAIKLLIEAKIGYSKLIFLDNEGSWDIFNEHKGVWDHGIWYSNTSYKPTPISVVKPKVTNSIAVPVNAKSIAPYKVPPAADISNRSIKQKDEVFLTVGHWDHVNKAFYPINTILEVVSVNSDHTVNAFCYEGSQTEYLTKVSLTKLDFLMEFDDSLDYDIELDLDPISNTYEYPWV